MAIILKSTIDCWSGHYSFQPLAFYSMKQLFSESIYETSMSDLNQLPESISHKQLSALLKTARQNSITPEISRDVLNQNQEAFNKLLTIWASLSEQLLTELNHKYDSIIQGRKPKSLMALGAFQAHLKLAVQAQKATDSGEEID